MSEIHENTRKVLDFPPFVEALDAVVRELAPPQKRGAADLGDVQFQFRRAIEFGTTDDTKFYDRMGPPESWKKENHIPPPFIVEHLDYDSASRIAEAHPYSGGKSTLETVQQYLKERFPDTTLCVLFCEDYAAYEIRYRPVPFLRGLPIQIEEVS